MPLYLCQADWDADGAAAAPLAETLAEFEQIVQRTGGQLRQTLQVDAGLSLTLETPDELSLFRIAREASGLGLRLSARAALPRIEAEALDRAHRLRITTEPN